MTINPRATVLVILGLIICAGTAVSWSTGVSNYEAWVKRQIQYAKDQGLNPQTYGSYTTPMEIILFLLLGFSLMIIGGGYALVNADTSFKCPNCKTSIDKSAEKCPNCGIIIPSEYREER